MREQSSRSSNRPLPARAGRVRGNLGGCLAGMAAMEAFAVALGVIPLSPRTGVGCAERPEVVADRYMYIPGVVVSLLAGGIVAASRPFFARSRSRRSGTVSRQFKGRSPHPSAGGDCGGVLAFLALSAAATWRQTRWWHDSITLWNPRGRFAILANDIAT